MCVSVPVRITEIHMTYPAIVMIVLGHMMKNLYLCGVHRRFTDSKGEVLTIQKYEILSSDIKAVPTEINSVHREVHSCRPGASH